MKDNREKFLHFVTSAQSFLIPLPKLYRIVSAITPKAVPFAPEYVEGIIHFEGNIWVVVDLDTILGVPAEESLTELVLTRSEECHLAFRARRTRDIVAVPEERRERRAVPGIPDACVEFITVLEGALTYCLNLEEFVEAFSAK